MPTCARSRVSRLFLVMAVPLLLLHTACGGPPDPTEAPHVAIAGPTVEPYGGASEAGAPDGGAPGAGASDGAGSLGSGGGGTPRGTLGGSGSGGVGCGDAGSGGSPSEPGSGETHQAQNRMEFPLQIPVRAETRQIRAPPAAPPATTGRPLEAAMIRAAMPAPTGTTRAGTIRQGVMIATTVRRKNMRSPFPAMRGARKVDDIQDEFLAAPSSGQGQRAQKIKRREWLSPAVR
jgi:hypothetical protein